MKKVFLILTAAIAFGCSDSDNTAVDPMLGTWKLTNTFYNETLFPATTCQLEERLTLNADHTFIMKNSIEGSTPESPCPPLDVLMGSFEVNNNVLTLSDEIGSADLQIFVANENRLEITSYSRSSSSRNIYVRE